MLDVVAAHVLTSHALTSRVLTAVLGVPAADATPGTAAGGAAIPNPPATVPPGLGPAVDTLLGWMKWGGLVAGVAGLLICAIMMMIGRRNRSAMAADGAAGIPWVLGGLTLVSFAAAIVGAIALNQRACSAVPSWVPSDVRTPALLLAISPTPDEPGAL